MLDLIETYVIRSPAIIGGCDVLIGREVVLVGEVVLCGQDDKRENSLAEDIDFLDYYYLFAVTRLS